KKNALHAHIGLHDKGVLKSRLFQIGNNIFKGKIVQNINRTWNKMCWQLIIHLFFALAFKTAKSDSGIRRTEKPERTAAQTIPEPYRADRCVKHIKIPQFPMGDSF